MTPDDVVRAELNAWHGLDVDEIVSHFHPDGVWDNVALGAHRGHAEIRAAVEGYVRRTESADLRLLNIAVNGNVVLTERIDEMVYDGNKISARCMGAFRGEGRQDHSLAGLLQRSVMARVSPDFNGRRRGR